MAERLAFDTSPLISLASADALAVGLRVVGTLGLLGRAKTLGLIDSVRPYVERIQERGAWFDEALVARVLSGLGE